VDTDIHDGVCAVWRLIYAGRGLGGLVYTNWRCNIASVKWGMGAWSRTGLEATIIVVSFPPRAKAPSFELEHNSIQSVGTVEARCSPAYYATRLATLDTCGVRVYRLR